MLTRATDSDVPAIVRLMNVAFRATGPGAGWNSEADIIDGDRTTEALLRAELAERPEVMLFVWRAEPGGAIQGCVSLEPKADGTWYLGTLSVDPRLQNSGFGRQLLAAAEKWAADRGARVMRRFGTPRRDDLVFIFLDKQVRSQ